MNNRLPLAVGITGGIGAGKSLVCNVFKKLGISVYNADSRARELMEDEPALINEIRSQLGEESYKSRNSLNTKYLAEQIFNNKDKLDLINNIVHPYVFKDFLRWRELHEKDKYLIKEAALLFESGSYRDLDLTILVYCPLDIRINRILLRDSHHTIESINRIVDNQMSDTKKKKLSDRVIINDGATMILPQILKLHEYLIKGSLQNH